MGEQTTIQAVAGRAGAGVATVSHVLDRPDRVRAEADAPGIAGARRTVGRLPDSGDRPAAVFGLSDELAAGAWTVAEPRAGGPRVPEDVAVTGYGDGPFAEALEPTTVRRPLEESGCQAAQLLFTGLADGPTVRETALRTEPAGRRTT
ncbi:substrate-binding domain-containing protein [Streptomyces sp. x-80]|uniref:substrate-binding domain-containing protein n=1 Tax=Streptomyces sp. x-80 TaxID=2789282 RepID=UPI00398054D6